MKSPTAETGKFLKDEESRLNYDVSYLKLTTIFRGNIKNIENISF